MFDNRAAMPNERIGAIRAPTLILHARDDGLQLFHNATERGVRQQLAPVPAAAATMHQQCGNGGAVLAAFDELDVARCVNGAPSIEAARDPFGVS